MSDVLETKTFRVPLCRWDVFLEKFAALNRKAKRLGCAPCTFQVHGDHEAVRSMTFKTEDGEYSKPYPIMEREVRVEGEAPRLADWTLVARVETLEGSDACLIHTVPGFEGRVNPRFRSLGAQVCEHCNTRRYRKDVYVVRHNDGTEKQVGRQCLADFTGINSPEKAAAQAAWLCSFQDLRDEDHYYGGGFRADEFVPCREILELTSFYIRRYGWNPRSAQNGVATADNVMAHFSWNSRVRSEAKAELAKAGGLTEEDTQRADTTLAWVKGELAAKEGRSEYEENLVRLVVDDLAKARHVGIIASAVATALRVKSRAQEAKEAREKLAATSVPFGELGKRFRDEPCTVQGVRMMDGAYGPTTLVKLVTDSGCVLTWFASGDHQYEPGTKVKVTATVKRFSEYNGIRETQISRAVIS